MMEILAIFNAKGGVGKTTTAVNLAVSFAAMGRKVLVFDLDSQGNATTSLGMSTLPTIGTYDVVTGRSPIEEAILPTFLDDIKIVGATRTLAAIDLDFALGKKRKDVIRSVVSPLENEIDIVVMDCPPAFGLMTVNALVSADAILIPSQPNPFAHDGLLRTWTILSRIRTELNHKLSVLGVLPTFINEDTRNASSTNTEQLFNDEIISAMQAEFGDIVHPVGIPLDTQLFTTAASKGVPASVLSPKSQSSLIYLDVAARLLHTKEPPETDGEIKSTKGNKGGIAKPSLQRINNNVLADTDLLTRSQERLNEWHEIAKDKGALSGSINVPSVDESAIREISTQGLNPAGDSSDCESRNVTTALAFIGTVLVVGVLSFLGGWTIGSGLY